MELIKKYLNALAEYLPNESKEEILKEVEANIYDMLQDDLSEENVKKVLMELGDPRILSRGYKGKQYLIGPDYYDSYIHALKVAVPLATVIFFILTLIPVLFSSDNTSWSDLLIDLFANSIGGALQGALTAAFITTIVFIIIERSDVNLKLEHKTHKKEPWNTSMLANVPAQKPYKFKKGDAIAEIIFTIIGTICFFTFAPKLGWYGKVDGEIELMALLFNPNRIYYYLGFAIILIVVMVIVNLLKLKEKYPNYKIAIVISIQKIVSMFYGLVFINDPKIFNNDFKTKAIDALKISVVEYEQSWQSLILFIGAMIILANVIDIIQVFYRSFKNDQYQK